MTKIYSTSDYSKFVFREDNRALDEKHVNAIAERMKEIGYEGAPVEVADVDGKFEIQDGQHRFEACRRTGTPVEYVVARRKTTYGIATANSMVKKWQASDYINAYATAGNTNYKRLNSLCNQFPEFTVSEIRNVVGGQTISSGRNNEAFEKGYLVLTDETFAKTREILIKLSALKKALTEKGLALRPYTNVLAFLLRENAIDVEKMQDKIEKFGNVILEKVSTMNKAIDYIERLYNYHSKGDVVYLRSLYMAKKGVR